MDRLVAHQGLVHLAAVDVAAGAAGPEAEVSEPRRSLRREAFRSGRSDGLGGEAVPRGVMVLCVGGRIRGQVRLSDGPVTLPGLRLMCQSWVLTRIGIIKSPILMALLTTLSDLESQDLSGGNGAQVIKADLGDYNVRGVINKNGINVHITGPAITDERFLLTPPELTDINPGTAHIMAVNNGERAQAHLHLNGNKF